MEAYKARHKIVNCETCQDKKMCVCEASSGCFKNLSIILTNYFKEHNFYQY